MKENTSFSLSVQREIERRSLNVESEVNKSINNLGLTTLLQRSGIRKQKGYAPISLLFGLILLPILKHSVSALWTRDSFGRLLEAQKDTFYRFLNHPRFNWRKLIVLVVNRVLASRDRSPFNNRVLIADDTVLPKTGKQMELVSYHHDHKTKRSQLGYQMLQLGYHNGNHFFPVDAAFHTSNNRTNDQLRPLDKRCNGWRRRAESFCKKTEVLAQMLRRCHQSGIDARFVLFDSWFAGDTLIAQILDIGYGVVCRLKAVKTRYGYQGESLTLKQLWHQVARHRLANVPGWSLMAATLNVELPRSGTVRLVFVRWSKKQWHCFLCTESDLEAAAILDIYSRRWAIEMNHHLCLCSRFSSLTPLASPSYLCAA